MLVPAEYCPVSYTHLSAGTKSPLSKSKISPGTIFSDGIWIVLPPRRTRLSGADSFCKASIACSALLSCTCLLYTSFMVLPVFRYAKTTIVQQKVKKQAVSHKPWWQKAFLDVILLALSLYALYSFHNQQAYLSAQMQNGGSLDPLLYFSSSVFIVGAGLLGIRLVPFIIRLIFAAGKRFWPPSVYRCV